MAYIGNTQNNQNYVPAIDYFNGDGSTVAFTLSRPVASVAAVQAVISNVPQNPTDAFTVSGNTITFTSAPPSGTNNIYVYYTSPNTQVIAPSDASVQTSSIANNAVTTAKISDGQITPAKLSTGYPYWDSSGNVGIGTSSPSYKTQISGASLGIALALTDTNTASGVGQKITNTTNTLNFGINNSAGSAFNGGGAYSAVFDATGAYPMAFCTNSAERMRIDSGGNLLVGTTSDISTTNVEGIQIWRSGAAIIRTRRPFTTAAQHYEFYNSNGQVGAINTSGTSTSYATSSDYRLKENIKPMQGALATVAQLNPVTYTWKADGSDGQGFIAHELQAVVPDCVTGEKDAVDSEGNPVYQGIDTSFLVATLTKAIQELKAEVDDLKAQLEAR